MNLQETISAWKDDQEVHKYINERFAACVNGEEDLRAFRDFVEGHNDTPVKIFGFGERSFIWMWKLLVDEMPDKFSFLEIGVFRGQILALIKLLANRTERKIISRVGVTPLDSTGGHWESDYAADIRLLHETFKLKQPEIIKGLSTDEGVIRIARGQYNMVYIDGGHEYEVVKQDIANYAPMVKHGGYLVIDDCADRYNLPNGYFRGIRDVSKAVDEVLPNEQFKELFNVVHNRVFQRV